MKKLVLQCKLKPETWRMLQLCGAVFLLIYMAAFAFYYFAGHPLEYQQSMIISEQLAKGLRAGFGIMCLGVLFMESK